MDDHLTPTEERDALAAELAPAHPALTRSRLKSMIEDRLVRLDGAHEGVGHADRDIEIGETARVLGRDEAFDVGMVDPQAGEHALLQPVQHLAVRRLEHLRAFHAQGGQRVDVEEAVARIRELRDEWDD